MENYKRRTVFEEIDNLDPQLKKGSFIEVCEWYNKEGYDITISSYEKCIFSISDVEYLVIKKLNSLY